MNIKDICLVFIIFFIINIQGANAQGWRITPEFLAKVHRSNPGLRATIDEQLGTHNLTSEKMWANSVFLKLTRAPHLEKQKGYDIIKTEIKRMHEGEIPLDHSNHSLNSLSIIGDLAIKDSVVRIERLTGMKMMSLLLLNKDLSWINVNSTSVYVGFIAFKVPAKLSAGEAYRELIKEVDDKNLAAYGFRDIIRWPAGFQEWPNQVDGIVSRATQDLEDNIFFNRYEEQFPDLYRGGNKHTDLTYNVRAELNTKYFNRSLEHSEKIAANLTEKISYLKLAGPRGPTRYPIALKYEPESADGVPIDAYLFYSPKTGVVSALFKRTTADR